MKRKIIEIISVIICFALQCTLLQKISFAGIVPNLLIIITSAFGFMGGRKEGMLVGFLSGLLMDIFYSQLLGLNALIFLYIGYVNGMCNRVFYPEDVKFPILFITLSDMSCLMLQYVFGYLLRARLDLPFYFMKIMAPEIIYTVLVTIVIYRPLLLINNRITDSEKRDE